MKRVQFIAKSIHRRLITGATAVLFAVTAGALDPEIPDGLIARAGFYNLPDNGFTISTAAGMELLDDRDDENLRMADDLVDFAFTFTGTRYRRGGKTPAGFDCSGFTGYIFSQFGYNLNADSRSQFLQGEAVDSDAIEPGDLLFFSGRAAGKIIGHVAIATDIDPATGVVTFIHSATGGGIRTDNTADPYYRRRFVGARRIIGIL